MAPELSDCATSFTFECHLCNSNPVLPNTSLTPCFHQNTFSSYFFTPQIIQPTRITDHSATLIDNIFLNSATHHTISGNIVYDISDHLPNFLIINKFSTLSKNVKIVERCYSNFNENDLINEIRSTNWSEDLSSSCEVNTVFENYYSKLSSIIDKHIPLRQLSKKEIKQKSKPWITGGIRRSIKIKNNFYKKYINTKIISYFIKFKLYRNKLKHLIDIAKNTYYNNFFELNRNKLKNVWKGIKSIISLKSKNCNLPSVIMDGENKLTEANSIAKAFNTFFVNIGKDLCSAIPRVNESPYSFMPDSVSNNIFLNPITHHEIENEIELLNPTKAVGPYSIPIDILKKIRYIISPSLETIYNLSITTGTVPDHFKIARVIPIHKNGSKLMVSNYRPISLLSIFNKILEKLIYRRLIKFFDRYRIFYNKQFGFRAKHSTTLAILSLIDKIHNAIEGNAFSCGIFLDFSKAFDTVNHEILLSKLEYYGIRGIVKQWFVSYLSNRKQFVSIGSVKSDAMSVNYGVPQGSVLGPLLFLLYINDFQNASKVLDFHIFADDSTLFYSNKNLAELERNVNNNLSCVHTWLCANKLSLNIDKSCFVIFHTTQKKKTMDIKLLVNNKPIKEKKSIRYLGIIIDSHLTWKSHISFIGKKIRRNIGIISKLRHFVNNKILINLYYALIYPFLTYGIVIWGNTYFSNVKPILTLQKKVIRIMTFSGFHDHTNGIFIELKLLKFPEIVFLNTALFMHDFYCGVLPSLFDDFFNAASVSHNYNTRFASRLTFSIPSIRTNYGKFNIRYVGTKIWNSIDDQTKGLAKNSFKYRIKEIALESYVKI